MNFLGDFTTLNLVFLCTEIEAFQFWWLWWLITTTEFPKYLNDCLKDPNARFYDFKLPVFIDEWSERMWTSIAEIINIFICCWCYCFVISQIKRLPWKAVDWLVLILFLVYLICVQALIYFFSFELIIVKMGIDHNIEAYDQIFRIAEMIYHAVKTLTLNTCLLSSLLTYYYFLETTRNNDFWISANNFQQQQYQWFGWKLKTVKGYVGSWDPQQLIKKKIKMQKIVKIY